MVTNSVELFAARWSQLAWPMFWQLSLVIVCVALATRICCRNRPHLAYILWMLVLVKALAPPIVSSPTSVFSWAAASRAGSRSTPLRLPPPARLPSADNQAVATTPPASAIANAPIAAANDATLSWAGWLMLMWSSGAVCMSALVVVRQFRLRSRLRATTEPPSAALCALVDRLRDSLGVRSTVRLQVIDASLGPALIGVVRPTIVIPRSLAGRSERELTPILAHELVHLRRGDTFAALLQVVVQIAWWFHPLVAWANREMRRQRELACDAEVLAALRCPGSDYAHSLLIVLESRLDMQPATIWPGIYRADVTSARIRRIASDSAALTVCTPRWCWALLALLALVTVPGAGLLLPAQEQPAANEEKIVVPVVFEPVD